MNWNENFAFFFLSPPIPKSLIITDLYSEPHPSRVGYTHPKSTYLQVDDYFLYIIMRCTVQFFSPGFRKSINRRGRRCLWSFSSSNSSMKVTVKVNEANLVLKVCSWLNNEGETYPSTYSEMDKMQKH